MESHAIVIAKFLPVESSYWLTISARITASKIPCRPFYALRFNFIDNPDISFGRLCAISILPPSLPTPDASFTLRPKYALDTDELSVDVELDDTQLRVQPPLVCLSDTLHKPVYLHTAPSLRVLGGVGQPVVPGQSRHQLDTEGFLKFQHAVSSHERQFHEAWEARTASQVADRLSYRQPLGFSEETLKNWARYGASRDPSYIFGQLHNPRAYCFEFVREGSIPYCDFPAPIYNQILLYAQICRDYRWESVEGSLDWVEAVRKYTSGLDDGVPLPECVKADVPVHASAGSLVQQDPTFRSQLAAVSALAATDILQEPDSDSECGEGSAGSARPSSTGAKGSQASGSGSDSDGSSSGVWVWWLPFNNPRVPEYFPRVPLRHVPRVVVLDMFDAVFDREGAIRAALDPWLPLARRPLESTEESVKLYLELEALTVNDLGSGATSLPTIVHSALDTFSTKVDMPHVLRPSFRSDAAAIILRPRPHSDVEAHIMELVRCGCTIVVLAPLSSSTLASLRPALPPRLLEHIYFFPVAIPLHTPVPENFFSQLRQWCAQVVLPAHNACAPEDILVATTGMGRILGPATTDTHPTALVMRPGGIECDVEYVLGADENSPHPSVCVDGLEGLCRAVDEAASSSG